MDLIDTLAPKSVQLCVTSPPYCLSTHQRMNYGNVEGDLGAISDVTEYIEFMVQLAQLFRIEGVVQRWHVILFVRMFDAVQQH